MNQNKLTEHQLGSLWKRFSRFRHPLTASMVAIGVAWWSAASAVPLYSLKGLGDLPGWTFSSQAYGINDSGQVAGQNTSANGPEAFLWDAANGMRGLGDLPGDGFFSAARGINDSGQGSETAGC